MNKDKFYIENQGIYTYLTYQLSINDDVDTMGLGMITNNQINGIAPVIYTQMDQDIFLKYNISARVSVSDFFSGVVNRKRLLGVFASIMDAIISAEEYMIDYGNLLFDLDYIYVDVSTNKAEMICVPIMNKEIEGVDLELFFKNIMFSTQFDQTENSDYVAKIMNYLNSSPTLNPVEFKLMINQLQNEHGKNNFNQSAARRQTAQVETGTRPQKAESVPPTPASASPVNTQPAQANSHKQLTPQMKPEFQGNVNPEVNSQIDEIQNKGKKKNKNKKKQAVISENVPISNINVPNQETTRQSVENIQNNREKRMSWFYLMQHYNKENAAIYKAQKANKKAGIVPPQANGIPSTMPDSYQTMNKVPVKTPPLQKPDIGMNMPGRGMDAVQRTEKDSMVNSAMDRNVINVQGAQQEHTLGQTKANFGETVVLNQGMSNAGETTVLGAGVQQMEIVPFLIRSKNNEKILLNKPVFRIGKEKSYVDYFVSDNPAVSRSHANIITREKDYFIIDTNSKNHTYVNGNMIQSNTEVKITHGTKIRLANEDFIFNLY